MDDKPAEHGGQVHQTARKLGRPVSEILDFSANINPLGPPPSVQRAILEALDDIRFYPDASHGAARLAIADRYGIAAENVLIGNGATEIIDIVIRFMAPRRVLIIEPAFSEYRASARRSRIPVISVSLERPEFVPPWDRIISEARPHDLLIWNNPHNPSGRYVSRSDFALPLRTLAERGVGILVDESFIDFVSDDQQTSALPEALEPGLDVLVVRSLTKFLAIPGLRLGYAVGDVAWVAQVALLRDRWSVSHFAQQAAVAGIKDYGFAVETQNWLRQARQQIKSLWAPGLKYQLLPTAVNFFLVRWADDALSQRVADDLFRRAILVRVCGDFEGLGSTYWRVAIRRVEENQRLLTAVQESLGDEGMGL